MIWIPFQAELALGTLAQDNVGKGTVLTFGEDFFAVGIKCTWAIEDVTADEGPISVGFAHGDLTAAEIREGFTAELTDPDDIIAKERSRRPVRRSGVFPIKETHEVLNHGVPFRTVMKFSIGDTHGLALWAHNDGSNANLTTGAIVHTHGHVYGRWQR